MLMKPNLVREQYEKGRATFGLYVMTPSTRMVEMLAAAGFDFVRIDLEGGLINIETAVEMIRTAHAAGITPFVRVQGPDEWQIQAVIKAGALGIIIPKVSHPDDIRLAVKYAKAAPVGERPSGPGLPSGGYGRAGVEEFAEWERKHVLLSAQIETKSGVDAIDEIVAIEGLDMVQSGRGDLSYHYGVPGEQYHDLVLEAENKVIEAGLRAEKMTSVQYYPMRDPSHVDRMKAFIERGVLCISCGSDADIVVPYRNMLSKFGD